MTIHSDMGVYVEHGTRSREILGVSSDAIPYALVIADAIVILAASVLSALLYSLAVDIPTPEIKPYVAVGLLASLIYVFQLSGRGHYELPEAIKPGVEISNIVLAWLMSGFVLATFAFLLKSGMHFSRGTLVISYLVAPVGLLLVRKFTKNTLSSAVLHRPWSRNDLVLVGDREEITALNSEHMVSFFGATDVARIVLGPSQADVNGSPGDERAMVVLVNFVRQHNCNAVVIALPWSNVERIEFVRERLKVLPVAIRLLPDRRVRSLSNFNALSLQPILPIEIQRAPLSGAERLAKRAIDIMVGSLALLSLLPIFVMTAIAIKFDSPGPVIFRQRRKGFNGQEFVMWKFRTMKLHNDTVVVQAMRNDPRLTGIGRFLRATSIDEIPQILNVLKGDMSLVGPRPHASAHDIHFQSLLGEYAFRHHVKPGITGWAQCNGSRGATPEVADVAQRVKFDLWYINNWSVWLDIHIMIKTFIEVMRKRNAY